jgi:hypothetical protein
MREMSVEDACHGPRRQPELGAKPVLATSLAVAELDHPLLNIDRCSSRAGVRPGGAVPQAGFTFGGVPLDPGLHALAGDPHRSRDVSLTPALLVTLNYQ